MSTRSTDMLWRSKIVRDGFKLDLVLNSAFNADSKSPPPYYIFSLLDVLSDPLIT